MTRLFIRGGQPTLVVSLMVRGRVGRFLLRKAFGLYMRHGKYPWERGPIVLDINITIKPWKG